MLERSTGQGFLLAMLAMLALAGCAAPPRSAPPAAPQDDAVVPGQVYELTGSDLAVFLYRDGPLAQLGHNHVVASTGLTGRLVLREPLESSSFELELPLASLVVDEPWRRRAAGEDFPGELSAEDRDGTRRNMLGPALLAAERFPIVRMEGVSMARRDATLEVTTRVTIAGAARDLVVPVEVQVGTDALEARGRFSVTHAELGLTPFSVAFGALRVREEMVAEFSLSARRAPGGPP